MVGRGRGGGERADLAQRLVRAERRRPVVAERSRAGRERWSRFRSGTIWRCSQRAVWVWEQRLARQEEQQRLLEPASTRASATSGRRARVRRRHRAEPRGRRGRPLEADLAEALEDARDAKKVVRPGAQVREALAPRVPARQLPCDTARVSARGESASRHAVLLLCAAPCCCLRRGRPTSVPVHQSGTVEVQHHFV